MARTAAARAEERPPRRTQEERRATTRAALLDATIECLVEYGYANVTTTKVVERAGVSRGAQVHHFPTKAALVAEAVSHLAARRAEELVPSLAKLPEGRDRVKAALDLLWHSHNGPLFQASLELWVAARTDPELRASLAPVEREVNEGIWSNAELVFGESAKADGFRAAIETTLSAMRGLALLGTLTSTRDLDRRWQEMRVHLLGLYGV